MIRALLIESDPRLRDIIEVGLDNFQAFEVDRAKDASALSLMQTKRYDLIIANVDLEGKGDGLQMIQRIREDSSSIEIIALAEGKSSRSRSKDKASASLFAVLPLPLDEQHFYKTMARARDRIEAKQAALKGEQAAEE